MIYFICIIHHKLKLTHPVVYARNLAKINHLPVGSRTTSLNQALNLSKLTKTLKNERAGVRTGHVEFMNAWGLEHSPRAKAPDGKEGQEALGMRLCYNRSPKPRPNDRDMLRVIGSNLKWSNFSRNICGCCMMLWSFWPGSWNNVRSGHAH